MAVKHETELYLPVKQMFEEEGYSVKGEVRHCDLVAYRDGEDDPIIVELKKTFNLALVFQVLERLKIAREVYAAVEYNPKKRVSTGSSWNDAIRLCKKLGVGLIGVQYYKRKAPVVHILCQPNADVPAGRRTAIGAKRLRSEFNKRSGDYNTGGSTGKKLVTAYREMSLRCAHALSLHETLSPRELREQLREPKIADFLQKNYYGWFERVSRGRYRITEEGKLALTLYAEVVNILLQKNHLSNQLHPANEN